MLPELLVWRDMLIMLSNDFYQGERLVLLKKAKATENDESVFAMLYGKMRSEQDKKREADREMGKVRR